MSGSRKGLIVDKPTYREESKLEYMDSLKRKYASFPEISRIARQGRIGELNYRHRHLPKVIKKMKDKEENRKKKDVKEFNEKECCVCLETRYI